MPATKPSLKLASPSAILTIPELDHAKATVLEYARLFAFSWRLQTCYRQIRCLVLLLAAAWIQPRGSVALSLVPRIALIVSRYDKSSSLRDPPLSR